MLYIGLEVLARPVPFSCPEIDWVLGVNVVSRGVVETILVSRQSKTRSLRRWFRTKIGHIFDGLFSSFALDRLQTLAFGCRRVLVCSLSVMSCSRFVKRTLVLWIAPPFGGALGSSLSHSNEIKIGRETDS